MHGFYRTAMSIIREVAPPQVLPAQEESSSSSTSSSTSTSTVQHVHPSLDPEPTPTADEEFDDSDSPTLEAVFDAFPHMEFMRKRVIIDSGAKQSICFPHPRLHMHTTLEASIVCVQADGSLLLLDTTARIGDINVYVTDKATHLLIPTTFFFEPPQSASSIIFRSESITQIKNDNGTTLMLRDPDDGEFFVVPDNFLGIKFEPLTPSQARIIAEFEEDQREFYNKRLRLN
jgi:hypothetical protein